MTGPTNGATAAAVVRPDMVEKAGVLLLESLWCRMVGDANVAFVIITIIYYTGSASFYYLVCFCFFLLGCFLKSELSKALNRKKVLKNTWKSFLRIEICFITINRQ